MFQKYVKLFLRIAVSFTMLSAVADRFGLWGEGAVWGNMDAFLAYTRMDSHRARNRLFYLFACRL